MSIDLLSQTVVNNTGWPRSAVIILMNRLGKEYKTPCMYHYAYMGLVLFCACNICSIFEYIGKFMCTSLIISIFHTFMYFFFIVVNDVMYPNNI